MRILGQIAHPQLQINVFKSNNKFILKFEIGPFEQCYKYFESGEIDSYESICKLVDEDFIQSVFALFDRMNKVYQNSQEKK